MWDIIRRTELRCVPYALRVITVPAIPLPIHLWLLAVDHGAIQQIQLGAVLVVHTVVLGFLELLIYCEMPVQLVIIAQLEQLPRSHALRGGIME